MSKTQLVSALGLALALAIVNTNLTYAEEVEQAAAIMQSETAEVVGMDSEVGEAAQIIATEATESKSAGTERPKDLQNAMDAVQKLVDREDGCVSETYPGIKTYLQGLLDKANKGTTSEAEYRELLAALNEGADGATLLLGLNRKDNVNVLAQNTDTKLPVHFYVPEKENNMAAPATGTAKLLEAYDNTGSTDSVEIKAGTDGASAVLALATGEETQIELAVVEDAEEKESHEDNANDAEELVELPNTGEVRNNAHILILAGAAVVIATAGATMMVLKIKKDA